MKILRGDVMEKLIDELDREWSNKYGDRAAATYFREMLKFALTRPANEWEQDYVVNTLRRDLNELQE